MVIVVYDCLDAFVAVESISGRCYWVIGPRVQPMSLVCPSSGFDLPQSVTMATAVATVVPVSEWVLIEH